MGWLPQKEFDRLRQEAEALTPEQRQSLTWEEAQRFVAADTLEIAYWMGMRDRKEMTPWQAVARLKRIDE